jgi:Spy/CpxP family protein refolding chaperone
MGRPARRRLPLRRSAPLDKRSAMRSKRRIVLLGLVATLGATLGLTDGGWAASSDAPYAGWQARPIKALSQGQVDDLLNGRGMGLALPAELNGYPGPRHVLDLAARLKLSPEQRDRTKALFEKMRARAVVLGERIVAGEQALDRLFETGRASEPAIQDATLEIGRLQGELRALHLGYHLTMRDVLTSDQIATYQRLRGYGAQGAHDGRAHGHSGRH